MSIQSECFALNIKKSEAARSSICRGLSLAENPFTLLIIAIRCIAEMSGDMSFIPMCEKAMENTERVCTMKNTQRIELQNLNRELKSLPRVYASALIIAQGNGFVLQFDCKGRN